MAGTTDVKSLLLEVDASVELLRRNLTRGDQAVGAFESETRARLDRMDRRFSNLGDGLRQLPTSVARARREIATIGDTTNRVEQQVRASSAAMRTALLASTAAIGAALSADRVKEYADSYTRFTNQLKVAGLEGAALAKTQADLYAIAQQYGVQLESLGGLYGRLSQGAKELGASQSDLLRFTTGVGAALKVQGGSAESTSGAIMQLTQALGGQIVRAEEFNSINEGARPILQAVANGIDRFGGSVSKLRMEVIDGKVSSQEFFQGFLKGSSDLEKQAAKANFTISASFTILNNALGQYIGQTDASLSATARVGQAVAALANNLDTIIPALAGIAVGYVGVKAGAAAFNLVTAATARALGVEQAVAAEIIKGNASYVGRTQLTALQATAAREAAAAEVAAIEATLVARRADQAAIAQTLAALQAQRAESMLAAKQQQFNSGLNFGLGRSVTERDASRERQDQRAVMNAKRALTAANAQVAASETALSGAHTRAAAATTAETTAVAANTTAKRVGAATSALFAGTLSTLAAAIPFLVIAGLTAAVIAYSTSAKGAAFDSQQFARDGENLAANLAMVDKYARSATGAMAMAGVQAVNSAGQMRQFASATGEAAQKLYELAKAKRRELLVGLFNDGITARRAADDARERRAGLERELTGSGREIGGRSQADIRRDIRNTENEERIATARMRLAAGGVTETMRQPLEKYVAGSATEGRDVEGDLARVTRDLVVARERGVRATIDSLEAQKFELTQYKKYRDQGLSPQAAQEASNRDATEFRNASSGAQGDRNARAGQAAGRRADAAARREQRAAAAEERDALADTARFSSMERRANNEIASARADLANSAEQRAIIEKARIEDERINRNEELRTQQKQGQLGEGSEAETRRLELQRLNDQRAQLETQVIDAREKQRIADEAVEVASAGRQNQSDLLRAQANLAVTAGDRRDLELRLLDLQYEEERARLDAVIASKDSTAAQRDIARQRKAILGDLQAADKRGVQRDNAGAVDQYRERIRSAVGDLGEALDTVKANGLQELEDGLVGIVTGTESVGSAFKKMASSIIADLARIAIQKAIVSAIGGGFLGFAEGGTIPGYADGGTLGGVIRGPGTGKSDSILALLRGPGGGAVRLSAGEGILTADALNHYGSGIVDRINSKQIPRFATGGLLGAPRTPGLRIPPRPELSGIGAGRRDRMTVDTRVKIEASELLIASMEETSVRTVAAAAEPIMAGAEGRTRAGLARGDLPGGWG